MQYLYLLIDGLLGFLDILELFFFAPISEVIARLPTIVLGSGVVGDIFSSLVTWIADRNLGFIGDLTLVQLLLGSGALIFLVYKLILFIIPVAD